MTLRAVSDAEIEAAKACFDRIAEAAGREQFLPSTLVRLMLEAAAEARCTTGEEDTDASLPRD